MKPKCILHLQNYQKGQNHIANSESGTYPILIVPPELEVVYILKLLSVLLLFYCSNTLTLTANCDVIITYSVCNKGSCQS